MTDEKEGPLFPRSVAYKKAIDVAQALGLRLDEFKVAGSIRREKEFVHDADILVAIDPLHSQRVRDRVRFLSDEILWDGPDKTSFKVTLGSERFQIDLRFIREECWGPALQYYTGSWRHNVSLRQIASRSGLKMSEYGVFKTDTGERIDDGTEAGVYRAIGGRWRPPKYREAYIRGAIWKGYIPKVSWCVDHVKPDSCKFERHLKRDLIEASR